MVGTKSAPVGAAVPSGAAQQIAAGMVAARGWGSDQFSCLVSLWNKESGWRTDAANSSGAYGIPQALPGSKMASRRRRLADQRGDPDHLGPAVHRRGVRHAVRGLGALAGHQLVLIDAASTR